MNNFNNMTGMPVSGQQQQRAAFPMQFPNQAAMGNSKTGSFDYTWHANISRELRDNVIKNLYLTLTSSYR
jgi:hypothetical protein